MNQHFINFFLYTVNWRTGMDHNRQETAIKHNQTFEMLSNLRLLPPPISPFNRSFSE